MTKKPNDTIVLNGEEYRKVNKVNERVTTVVNFILDMSGSMQSVKEATISGFNEYLGNLKKDGNDYRVNVTFFDDLIEKPYVDAKIYDVMPIRNEYQPRGMTALYDAICKTVSESRKLGNHEKALVVIMTDGGENSSKEYTEQDFIRIKEKLEDGGNYTFVFLGANQDAWGVAGRWGFAKNNVARYNATKAGTKFAFDNMSRSTSMYAASADFTTQEFMSDKDKKDIEETK